MRKTVILSEAFADAKRKQMRSRRTPYPRAPPPARKGISTDARIVLVEKASTHPLADINNIVYNEQCDEQRVQRWLAQQGAVFRPGKGSHLKVYLNGKQSVLPMHNAELKKGLVEGVKKQLGLK